METRKRAKRKLSYDSEDEDHALRQKSESPAVNDAEVISSDEEKDKPDPDTVGIKLKAPTKRRPRTSVNSNEVEEFSRLKIPKAGSKAVIATKCFEITMKKLLPVAKLKISIEEAYATCLELARYQHKALKYHVEQLNSKKKALIDRQSEHDKATTRATTAEEKVDALRIENERLTTTVDTLMDRVKDKSEKMDEEIALLKVSLQKSEEVIQSYGKSSSAKQMRAIVNTQTQTNSSERSTDNASSVQDLRKENEQLKRRLQQARTLLTQAENKNRETEARVVELQQRFDKFHKLISDFQQ